MPDMLNGPDGSEAPNEDAREARCTCDRTETLLLVGGEPMCPWCAACTALDPASLPRRPVEVLVAVGVRSDRMEAADA